MVSVSRPCDVGRLIGEEIYCIRMYVRSRILRRTVISQLSAEVITVCKSITYAHAYAYAAEGFLGNAYNRIAYNSTAHRW